jgi:cephalosporin hydroxylase
VSSYEEFKSECKIEVSAMGADQDLKKKSLDWMIASSKLKYSYHFDWLGRPIIQFPQDIVALQEIIWANKPDLIIETGIAHGGSLILSASVLALLDLIDQENGEEFRASRKVIGIDIDIREHNKRAILGHPLASRIEMFEGSSIAPEIVDSVRKVAQNYSRIMVILDSNHTHDHVLQELKLYNNFVTSGQYLIVFDTVIENFPADTYFDRPWDVGNNPKTAVKEFLKMSSDFYLDETIENKLLITVAPNGYLVRR